MSDLLWDHREARLLESIQDAVLLGRTVASSHELVRGTGLAADEVVAGLRALLDDQMIFATDASDGSTLEYRDIGLRPRGLREVGEWPLENGYRNLVAMLEYRIAVSASASEQEKTTTLLQSVRDVGPSAIDQLVSDLLRRAAGPGASA